MINQPPPAYQMPMPMPQPIGFEQPPPPPLNAMPQQVPTYVYPSGRSGGADPLIQEQARIHALNATPGTYNSGWRRYSSGDRKVATIIVGVVGLVFIIIFLVIFFTVFKKSNDAFEEAKKRQEEFHNKYFSNW